MVIGHGGLFRVFSFTQRDPVLVVVVVAMVVSGCGYPLFDCILNYRFAYFHFILNYRCAFYHLTEFELKMYVQSFNRRPTLTI